MKPLKLFQPLNTPMLIMLGTRTFYQEGKGFQVTDYAYYHPAGTVTVSLVKVGLGVSNAKFMHSRCSMLFECWADYSKASEPTDRQLSIRAGKFINECISKATN